MVGNTSLWVFVGFFLVGIVATQHLDSCEDLLHRQTLAALFTPAVGELANTGFVSTKSNT